MRVAVACDHGGFPLKDDGHRRRSRGRSRAARSRHELRRRRSTIPTSPPRRPAPILRGDAERAIVICGSGVGAAVAANKLRGIRAGVCHDTYSAHQAVEHDDVNVLSLGAAWSAPRSPTSSCALFSAARYTSEERHAGGSPR